MKQQFNENTIVTEAYARLVKDFVYHESNGHPRIVLVGFDSIANELEKILSTKMTFVMPERSGRLKEASLLRGMSDDCIVLIGRHSLGKFASLVTAFKILDETVKRKDITFENRTDIFDIISLTGFLINHLDVIGQFIQEKMPNSKGPLNYTMVGNILLEILSLARRRNSYYDWLYPKKILSALVFIHVENSKNSEPSIASFLRMLSIEATRSLEKTMIFSNRPITESEAKELRQCLLGYSRVLRFFLSSDVTTQRRNIARLCNNQLRLFLYELSEKELKTDRQKKWIKAFFDYERIVEKESDKGKKKRKESKYKVEPRGVCILERSSISGLPLRMLVPVNVTLLEATSRNLLAEFYNGLLSELVTDYAKLGQPNLSVTTVNLSDDNLKLVFDFKLVSKDGYIKLDTFLDGLRNPSMKVHRILEEEFSNV